MEIYSYWMNDVLCNGIFLWILILNVFLFLEIFINWNIGKCWELILMVRLVMLDFSSGGYLFFVIKDLCFYYGVGFMYIW